jgi:hypothetical protein
MVVRRARTRGGILRLHAHLFRHGKAHAADVGAIQAQDGGYGSAVRRSEKQLLAADRLSVSQPRRDRVSL